MMGTELALLAGLLLALVWLCRGNELGQVGWSVGRARGTDISHTESRARPPTWGLRAIREYIANLHALQGPAPYSDSSLGYGPETLALLPGAPMDLAAGAKRAASERITDIYARPGAPGVGSYAYNAAHAGLENEYAARGAEAARSVAVADAILRREDAERRLRYGLAAGNLARAFANVRGRSRGYYLHRTASVGQGPSGGSSPGVDTSGTNVSGGGGGAVTGIAGGAGGYSNP